MDEIETTPFVVCRIKIAYALVATTMGKPFPDNAIINKNLIISAIKNDDAIRY